MLFEQMNTIQFLYACSKRKDIHEKTAMHSGADGADSADLRVLRVYRSARNRPITRGCGYRRSAVGPVT